ncbi:MAG: dihydrodipicolinate synthase family protein [Verrucomicrobiaceae bacterium]|nr:dihydrodipicolinate synthase family protein [Verrucomicrobiaceae bacterium]
MQTTPITYDDLRSSVISVPPLARKADLSLNDAENTKLIKHLEAGGVRTFLYGGNANLYNIAVSEFGKLLEFLAGAVAPTSIVVPSVGPFYGNIVDQADILKGFKFPTAMILPTLFPAKPAGIQTAVRHFVERSGIPAVLYIKDANYMPPEAAAQLVDEGLISWVKYAIVCENPAVDPYLSKLVDLVDRKLIVSGIGEQPAIVHLRDFGITGFTSGCVCVAPALSMKCMNAIHREDYAEAERIRELFFQLEDQRNTHGPIPVLHHAVALSGVADTGPFLPLLAPLADERLPAIQKAALDLLALNQ